MSTIYQLKSRFQNSLRPLSNKLVLRGISANEVTIAALSLSVGYGVAIALLIDQPLIFFGLPIILFVRMALNAIDGMMAREHGLASPLGAVLNELSDIISDIAIYLPFALIPGVHAPLVIAFVLLSVLSETAGLLGVQIGATRRYDGPLGKSDRAFVFGGLAIMIGSGLPLTGWVNGLFAVLCCLLMVTIFNRTRHALKEIKHA